jgi:hypothetical protein
MLEFVNNCLAKETYGSNTPTRSGDMDFPRGNIITSQQETIQGVNKFGMYVR